MDQHNATVNQISTRLKQLYSKKESFRIFHGSTNSTRNYSIDRNKMIDTSSLNHVLSIDSNTRTALVEPNVSMEKLVEATLPFGLVPPVVMEFRGITAGGGFAGTGAESSSFRHGSFDCSVNWMEIVLADGEMVKASREHNADLFYGATGSLGTLGVTTLLELRLIEAQRYVQVTYTPCDSLEQTLQELHAATEDPSTDYVDGMLLSATRGVVISGHLTSTASAALPIRCFTRAQDPWFYMHAAQTLETGSATTELIPLTDYLFRYDRGAFWMGKYAFDYFIMPCNRLTRWALNPFMQTSTMYHALHASGHSQHYIIQDVAIPTSSASAFIQDLDQTLGIYPLWLCPLEHWDGTSFHPHALPTPVLNIGIWGPNSGLSIPQNRNLESLIRKHAGRKWLYAQAFYTEDEFWSIYDKRQYTALREKYKAEHLPSVFDKACVGSLDPKSTKGWMQWLGDKAWNIWPVSGVYGVLQTMLSKEYLLAKR